MPLPAGHDPRSTAAAARAATGTTPPGVGTARHVGGRR